MTDDDPVQRLANLKENMENLKSKFRAGKITFKDYMDQARPIQKAIEATEALIPRPPDPHNWVAAGNEPKERRS